MDNLGPTFSTDSQLLGGVSHPHTWYVHVRVQFDCLFESTAECWAYFTVVYFHGVAYFTIHAKTHVARVNASCYICNQSTRTRLSRKIYFSLFQGWDVRLTNLLLWMRNYLMLRSKRSVIYVGSVQIYRNRNIKRLVHACMYFQYGKQSFTLRA